MLRLERLALIVLVYAFAVGSIGLLAVAQWSEWECLGGSLDSAPVVTSWEADRLDIFARGADGALWHMCWDGTHWCEWESLGGNYTGTPACVSWGPNRIDCFVRGADSALWHKYWDQGWSEWESLGGYLLSSPVVTSWGPGRLDVFARGIGSALWHIGWNGSAWIGWNDLGGCLSGTPACVSRGANRIDCFVRGEDAAIWHKYCSWSWLMTYWSEWESLGGSFESGPTAISLSPDRLDVFALRSDMSLWHLCGDGTGWCPWEEAAPSVKGWSCVSCGSNRIDCLVALWGPSIGVFSGPPRITTSHAYWDGSHWFQSLLDSDSQDYSRLSAIRGLYMAECVSWGPGRIDCFMVGEDRALWHTRWGD